MLQNNHLLATCKIGFDTAENEYRQGSRALLWGRFRPGAGLRPRVAGQPQGRDHGAVVGLDDLSAIDGRGCWTACPENEDSRSPNIRI